MTKRQTFADQARPLAVTIADTGAGPVTIEARPVARDTGTCGFTGSAVFYVTIGGVTYEATAGLTVTIKGSKQWPRE